MLRTDKDILFIVIY